MKQKIILKSIFTFALFLVLSSSVYSSEITGNLSSAGVNTSTNTIGSIGGTVGSGSEVTGTLGSGNISGNVGGGGSSGGGGGGGGSSGMLALLSTANGSVLGVSTVSTDPVYTDTNITTNTKTTPQKDIYIDNTESNTHIAYNNDPIQEVQAESIDSGISAAVGGSGFNFGSWFWISLLVLLIIAIAMYIDSRRDKKDKPKII